MGIFKNVFNNKNNQKPINNDPYFDYIINYFDNDTDFDVDSKNVINISSDVFAMTSRIANDLASKQIKSTNSFMANTLNNKINQYSNAHDTWVSLIMNMLIFGDGFGLLETNNPNGTVSGIQVLPSYNVTIVKGSNGLTYKYGNETFSGDQIIHLRFSPLNMETGVNPLSVLKDTLKLSRASNQLLQNYYKDSAFQKVLLQASGKLTKDQKDKIRTAFSQSVGSNNAGGALVTDETVKISPFSSTNVSAETVKQLKANDYIKKAVASVYGCPYELIGVENTHSNGSDIIARYRFDLNKYINGIESELNRKLTGTYKIDNPIQPLSASDLANLVKNGVLNSAEAKQYLE